MKIKNSLLIDGLLTRFFSKVFFFGEMVFCCFFSGFTFFLPLPSFFSCPFTFFFKVFFLALPFSFLEGLSSLLETLDPRPVLEVFDFFDDDVGSV